MLIAATGGLTEANVPRLPGLETFQGEWWHSAAWRHDVDLTGARVAVVGSAASAVQVVPEVARRAAQVYVFQRTPNWVSPRRNRAYQAETKANFAEMPAGALRAHRRALYRQSLWTYRVFRKNPRAVEPLRQVVLDHMRASIRDPEMLAALTPKYDPGCKRLLVSDEYYAALALPHVRLAPEGVREIMPIGPVSEGGFQADVDVIIFCTGYRLGGRSDGRPAIDIRGRNGTPLLAALTARPEAYRGVAIPGFPNYFTVNGINGPIAYTSLIGSAEVQARYLSGIIHQIGRQNLRSVAVHADVSQRYNEQIQAELQTVSWAGDCPSFYKDASSQIRSFYPRTLGRMRREFRRLSLNDCVVRTFGETVRPGLLCEEPELHSPRA